MRILRNILALILMIFFIMTDSGHLNRQQIFTLVTEHHELLREYAETERYEEAEQLPGILSVDGGRLPEGSYTVFWCGGSGIAPSSAYYGFYYSPDDIPLAVDVADTADLRPEGNGFVWRESWERPGGDNAYRTERIMEQWYYFESQY